MEKGLFHPARGYWQAIGGGDLSRYPEGTIEVPLKPGANFEFIDGAWVPVTPPAQIPQAVSAFQFKAHLDALGKLADAEALVAGSAKIVQLAWDSATEFRRNSPTVNQMAAQLGFTTKDAKDAFFIEAAKIEL